MEHLFSFSALVSLLSLTLLEIILGIDNIIFISIISGKLQHKKEQRNARNLGLSVALLVRVIMLSGIAWLAGSTKPLFEISLFRLSVHPSLRDIILMAGGLFLIYKTTVEIYEKVMGHEEGSADFKPLSVSKAIVQIVLIDIVFSFDSILTAIGLSRDLPIMITAVVISMIVMLLFSEYIADFINKHPTIKMLALSFLILIGGLLVLESVHFEIQKGYVYFALGFSLIVEWLNITKRSLAQKRGN